MLCCGFVVSLWFCGYSKSNDKHCAACDSPSLLRVLFVVVLFNVKLQRLALIACEVLHRSTSTYMIGITAV